MRKEIERKFLFKGDLKEVIKSTEGIDIEDFYFNKYTRLRFIGDKCWVGIKGDGTLCRDEFESLLEHVNKKCGDYRPLLCKTRYSRYYEGHTFEINVYKTLPLITVEVELESADEEVILPEWCGREITDNVSYYNYNLWEEIYNNGRFDSVSKESGDSSAI